jgi:hypothetical protein
MVMEQCGTKPASRFTGRPPFGYCVKKGQILPDKTRQAYIVKVFTRLREGKNWQQVIDEMKEVTAHHDKKNTHWDYTKLKRILSHTDLYCRGIYLGNQFPHLAFLPQDWAETAKRKESA